MTKPNFVYVIYIATTAERLWAALTDGNYTQEYWGGTALESDWQIGSPIVFHRADGQPDPASARVASIDPPWHLVMDWTFWPDHRKPEPPPSHVTFAIQRSGPENVKLTVTHEDFESGEVEEGLRNGWPAILSSLKSYLETGQALDATRAWAQQGPRSA